MNIVYQLQYTVGLRQFICCNEHLFPQQVVDMDLIVQVHKTHLIQGPS